MRKNGIGLAETLAIEVRAALAVVAAETWGTALKVRTAVGMLLWLLVMEEGANRI